MKFEQNLSLLLWLYRGKASKDGKAPIYFRITIDGLDTDISLGQKIHPDFWDGDAKQVRSTGVEEKNDQSEDRSCRHKSIFKDIL